MSSGTQSAARDHHVVSRDRRDAEPDPFLRRLLLETGLELGTDLLASQFMPGTSSQTATVSQSDYFAPPQTNFYPQPLPSYPAVPVSGLEDLDLEPHVKLGAFGPGKINPGEYRAVKTVLTPLQNLYSGLGGGSLMCYMYPSSCGPRTRARRSVFSRRKFGGRSRFGNAAHSFYRNAPIAAFSPRPSPYGLSTPKPKRVSSKNLPALGEFGSQITNVGITAIERGFGLFNSQQDRAAQLRAEQMQQRQQQALYAQQMYGPQNQQFYG